MSDVTSNERLERMVAGILDAIEAGDDPQPLVARLAKAQPWLIAQMGMEYTEQAVQRVREADERISNGP